MINNLGGKGPRRNQRPEVMRFASVGEMRGQAFDLVVSTTNRYFRRTSRNNGCARRNGFGRLNLKGGRNVNLRFCFVQPDDTPVTVPAFHFTFFDLDQGNRGSRGHVRGRESIEVHGFTNYTLADGSYVHAAVRGDAGTFSSTREGHWHDNPTVPTALTEFQRRLSVTLLFTNTQCFDATYAVSRAGRNGNRYLLFDGESNLTPQCSTAKH